MSILATILILAAAQAPTTDIAVSEVEGELVVDLAATAVDPLELLHRFARESGRRVEGDELLLGRPRLDVALAGRSLESVLELVGHATRTRIALTRRTITIMPEHALSDTAELDLDAEAAWVSLLRDFPGDEVARVARVELGHLQEKLGHEDAALAHYDAAVVDPTNTPASERALRAAGALLLERGDWSAAMRRYSRLAQSSADERTQIEARLAIAHALAEQGRGAEALALIDVIDLSYRPISAEEVAERGLSRARAHMAAGQATEALHELDKRAASDPRLGGRIDDLSLRARALEALDAPLEAARAWIACSSVAAPAHRGDALLAAARLSAAGGDDIAVLFIERLAQATARADEVTRLADSARERLGIDPDARGLARLEERWRTRSVLPSRERAALAVELVTVLARERGADAATTVAREAQEELPGPEARSIRSALASAYESEGAWAEAARVWGGPSR